MCLILHGHEQAKYPEHFDALFRLRYKKFIEERQWSLPSRDGKERDQYDTDDAVYFLTLNDDGTIESSLRATPTMHSSLLADYFPHLIDPYHIEKGVSARSPRIYEVTRYIVQPKQKSRAALRQAKVRLLAPLVQWALDRGLTHLQTVIDSAALATFVDMTLHTRPLGLSHPYGGGTSAIGGGECLAFRWPVSPALLDDIQGYGDVSHQRPAERLADEALMH